MLHYIGADDDRGGIVSVVRNLAGADRFDCVLGVNPGCVQSRPPLPAWELPRVLGDRIDFLNLFRCRRAAGAVRRWLQEDSRRVFHGHSRAGLLVGLWLSRWKEPRSVVSIHCYGRQRWFYRWAARTLGSRLFWLTPAMRGYYGAPGEAWEQCIPGCVPRSTVQPVEPMPGRLRLGGVGMLVRWKQWDLVIRALGMLPENKRSAVMFTHIGDGDRDYGTELKNEAERLGLSGSVDFKGQQASPDDLLGRVDAVIVASRNEPFSIAMLEALAAGVPVIAAASGGASDIIRDGVNGCMFADGDAGALSGILERWIDEVPRFDREKIRRSTPSADDVAGLWDDTYSKLGRLDL